MLVRITETELAALCFIADELKHTVNVTEEMAKALEEIDKFLSGGIEKEEELVKEEARVLGLETEVRHLTGIVKLLVNAFEGGDCLEDALNSARNFLSLRQSQYHHLPEIEWLSGGGDGSSYHLFSKGVQIGMICKVRPPTKKWIWIAFDNDDFDECTSSDAYYHTPALAAYELMKFIKEKFGEIR